MDTGYNDEVIAAILSDGKQVGDRVAEEVILRNGGLDYRPGTIIKRDRFHAQVRYDDGKTEWTDTSRLMCIAY